ncbi:Fur family transcriptional regulator [Membranihabitans maritimus]|uniref:Fur family transcriptional regulator n=1 Tax=Membranihabitans maritimus TaxID=2904244 RepID=UPI001F01DA93|nr:transcriptional repressor [Membranihabitans maritimus]
MNEYENTLLQKNIRPTAMRLLVLEELSKQNIAISLSDLEKTFAKSDRITLYRTLKTFEENNLVHSIDDGTGAPKYALFRGDNLEKDMHLHFHCRMCNETLCLPKYQIPDIELPKNYKPEEANLVIKGVCDHCNY